MTTLSQPSSPMRVALAHDYLIKNGGAELVLEELHHMFPEAPIFTLLYDERRTDGRYKGWDIRLSWLQNAPSSISKINYYRSMMPQAVESFDLGEYDVVISDASSFIKGVITQPGTVHISYIHTPTRFLWFDMQSHIRRASFGSVAKTIIPMVLNRVRQWDFIAAQRPDILVANSRTTQKRIEKFYRRESEVIYPPVKIEHYDASKRNPSGYFLIVSRLEPHKEIEMAIEACNAHNLPLHIIGSGTYEKYLRSLAGPSIHFLGRLNNEEVRNQMYGALAFIAPQVEDFGISMVEALAGGCPVIAPSAGGASEIVVTGISGILIDSMGVDSLGDTLASFDYTKFNVSDCVDGAERFSSDKFRISMGKCIDHAIAERTQNGTK